MKKLSRTITARSDRDKDVSLSVTIDVDVNAEGLFTTTLSPEAARIIDSYGISLRKNKAGRPGFFLDKTLEGLCQDIRKVLEACVDYHVVSETPVIRYYIDTYCTYFKDADGNVFPNGCYCANGKWQHGTIPMDSTINVHDFGLKFWACPFIKVITEYGNGVQKVSYQDKHDWAKGTNMKWLNDLCLYSENNYNIKEVPGTEENAEFFVKLVKSLINLNEKIGDFLKEDNLERLIALSTQTKLLE